MLDLVVIFFLGLLANIQTGVATLAAVKGKYGMFVGGFLLGILWFVAAIRLAMPDSVWARTFYGPDKLGESVRRFPVLPGRPWPYPAPPTVVPAQVTRGVLLAVAALARRGVRWARTTTVVMVAVMAVSGTVLGVRMAPEPDPVYVIATGLQLLLAVGAWHQLHFGEARRYFRRDPSFAG